MPNRPVPISNDSFYSRASLVLVGLFVLVYILVIVQDLILPLMYAFFLTVLISPLVDAMQRKRVNRAVATGLVLALVFSGVAGILSLVVWQAGEFTDALPQLADRFRLLMDEMVLWASAHTDRSPVLIDAWLRSTMGHVMQSRGEALGSTLSGLGGVMAGAVLTPVYVFMMVLYKPHLVAFLHRLSGADNDARTTDMLMEIRTMMRSFLVGLCIQFVLLAILNSVGLLIIGIRYAILLGVIGAFLNLIPYLGALVGVFLFMAVALVTATPMHVLYVVVLYLIMQFLDNNFITPKVLGGQVRLNPLVSIISVVAGAALWGVPGMLLGIPLAAIIKIVLDRIPALADWGFLMGDPQGQAK
jgi:predicted PurR-regulated permease PerM